MGGELRAQQLRRRVRGRPRGSRERGARQWPRWRRRIAVCSCGERYERESDDRKQSDEREPQWSRLWLWLQPAGGGIIDIVVCVPPPSRQRQRHGRLGCAVLLCSSLRPSRGDAMRWRWLGSARRPAGTVGLRGRRGGSSDRAASALRTHAHTSTRTAMRSDTHASDEAGNKNNDESSKNGIQHSRSQAVCYCELRRQRRAKKSLPGFPSCFRCVVQRAGLPGARAFEHTDARPRARST